MNKSVSEDSFARRIWKYFASIRLTIFLLSALAATSIVGTLIPQNAEPAAYFQEYGETFYRLFNAAGMFDMYHSWWFRLLLVLLTVNIVVCSIERLSTTWKIVFTRNPKFNPEQFRNNHDAIRFSAPAPVQSLKEPYAAAAGRGFGFHKVEAFENGFRVMAERGRWTRLGVYTVHLSVVLLLCGGLIGSIFGFDGSANIPVGEVIDSVRLRNSGKAHQLPFQIRCDDFSVSYYDTGAPKEYRSRLTVIEQGKPVLNKDIIVNDPMRYKGINVFQASYGTMPPREVVLEFTSGESGQSYEKKSVIGNPVELPEGGGSFELKGFQERYSFRNMNLGQTFMGVLTDAQGKAETILMPVQYPSFDKMRKGAWSVSVKGFKPVYYTGLQITGDPGVLLVYAGFIVMIIGCFITFFMSHLRLFVEVTGNGNKSRVLVSGSASKNRIGMQKRLKKLAEELGKSA